jgi:hypothetical protein
VSPGSYEWHLWTAVYAAAVRAGRLNEEATRIADQALEDAKERFQR